MIKLQKLPIEKVELITQAVKHFIEHGTVHYIHTEPGGILISIAREYLPKLLTKINKQYPARSNTINLLYHQAKMLEEAFSYYQATNPAHIRENNVLQMYRMELNQKLV